MGSEWVFIGKKKKKRQRGLRKARGNGSQASHLPCRIHLDENHEMRPASPLFVRQEDVKIVYQQGQGWSRRTPKTTEFQSFHIFTHTHTHTCEHGDFSVSCQFSRRHSTSEDGKGNLEANAGAMNDLCNPPLARSALTQQSSREKGCEFLRVLLSSPSF